MKRPGEPFDPNHFFDVIGQLENKSGVGEKQYARNFVSIYTAPISYPNSATPKSAIKEWVGILKSKSGIGRWRSVIKSGKNTSAK